MEVSDVVEYLLEFFEAFIHQVLFKRKVYSQKVFESRLLYGIPIHRCRHPTLCHYVQEIVSDLTEPLANGKIQKLSVNIQSASKASLERFTIELVAINYDLCQPRQLERELRGCLLRVQNTPELGSENVNHTFVVEVYTKEDLGIDRWIEEPSTENQCHIVPLRTIPEACGLGLQVYIEQQQQQQQ